MNSRQGPVKTVTHSSAGFTLMEILVAIFIFALLITTVFGSFRAVFSSADTVGGDVAVFASARSCLGRMATDLSALYISDYPFYKKPGFNDPQDPYRLVGDVTDLAGSSFGRLRFASLAHLPINRDSRQGVARIIYYAHQQPDGSLVLRRADHLYPFPEFEESEDDPILCAHLLALEYRYADADGEPNEQWDSESSDMDFATPRSVEIRLTIGQPSRPMTFSTRTPLHVFRQAAE